MSGEVDELYEIMTDRSHISMGDRQRGQRWEQRYFCARK